MRNVKIGGNKERIEIESEEVVRDARAALAKLQEGTQKANHLIEDLKQRLEEVDEVETFAKNVNYYRQKQAELESLLAEVTATRAAAETAQNNAVLMRSAANAALAEAAIHDTSIAQSVEANEYAINQWRQELGNANNVYTGLEMLRPNENITFGEVLEAMSVPSVGYFTVIFPGKSPDPFAATLLADREFLPDLEYYVQATINRFADGYAAEVRWTAKDVNGVFAPMTYEDRTVMGKFDTGWAVRAYYANHNVMSF